MKWFNMKKILVICLFLISFLTQNFSQEIRQDFGAWTYIELKKKISKKWDFSGEYEYRLKDNLYQLRNNFVEFKLTRDLPNKWETSFYFRGISSPGSYKARITHTISKSIKFRDLTFKYRLRHDFQRSVFTPEVNFEAVLRNRLGVQYKWSKLPLKNSIFVEINNDYEASFLLVDRLRFKGASKIALTKELDLELSFLTQRKYHVAQPKRDYVVVMGISYEL